MNETLKIGDKVAIVQNRIGGSVSRFGFGVVAKASPRKVTLEDGSVWRADGYRWGSQPTRGCGRHFERRIEKTS